MSAALVCVVDDDEAVREALGRLLRSAGHAVALFASGAELLDGDVVARAGCLVLDIRMPRMSGPEVQRRLADKAACPPIIFMTAREEDGLKARLVSAGALDVLYKPFDEDELLALIAEALRRGGA